MQMRGSADSLMAAGPYKHLSKYFFLVSEQVVHIAYTYFLIFSPLYTYTCLCRHDTSPLELFLERQYQH